MNLPLKRTCIFSQKSFPEQAKKARKVEKKFSRYGILFP